MWGNREKNRSKTFPLQNHLMIWHHYTKYTVSILLCLHILKKKAKLSRTRKDAIDTK